MIFVFQGC